jgi:hypothetical protein
LRDALDGFYSGREVQALNVAVTLRVLVHETKRSKSLLSRMNPDYWSLTILHVVEDNRYGNVLFAVTVPFQVDDKGNRLIRPTFDNPVDGPPSYVRVPLKNWWEDNCQALFGKSVSKKTIVLNVADTDGGAHVDDRVADTHAFLAEPPFQFGTEGALLIRPNLAYGTVAQCGCEMQDFLEHHFSFVKG